MGRRLAEMTLKPWRKNMWCIPTVNAEYVARMEDVLDLYAEPLGPGDRWSASMKHPGNSSVNIRYGTANVFLFRGRAPALAPRQGH